MVWDLSPHAIGFAVVIFLLRILNQTLDTMRILMMMRGGKLSVWLLGFTESLIFVLTLTGVLQDLDNPLNVLVYAGGFATGNTVGMWLESRLALGYFNLRIVSPRKGEAIADKLRDEGYAITEIPARGRSGAVTLLNASVRRRDVDSIRQIVEAIDEGAFMTGEEMRPIWRGFWRSEK